MLSVLSPTFTPTVLESSISSPSLYSQQNTEASALSSNTHLTTTHCRSYCPFPSHPTSHATSQHTDLKSSLHLEVKKWRVYMKSFIVFARLILGPNILQSNVPSRRDGMDLPRDINDVRDQHARNHLTSHWRIPYLMQRSLSNSTVWSKHYHRTHPASSSTSHRG